MAFHSLPSESSTVKLLPSSKAERTIVVSVNTSPMENSKVSPSLKTPSANTTDSFPNDVPSASVTVEAVSTVSFSTSKEFANSTVLSVMLTSSNPLMLNGVSPAYDSTLKLAILAVESGLF